MSKRTVRLIRDKVADLPLPKGVAPFMHWHISNDFACLALIAKMHEETSEIQKDMGNPEEYADLLTAMYELAKRNRVTAKAIHAAYMEKMAAKGGFEDNVVMARLPDGQ